jgi:pyruvate,orthophosphate dikinase
VPFEAGSRSESALLGGKGANLAALVEMGAPVPPGFVITTAACRAFSAADGELPEGLLEETQAGLDGLAKRLGRRFGDAEAPLLVSVRSGAPASMPGMMDTVLNVGLAGATLPAFAAWIGDDGAAGDCLRRLRQTLEELTGEPAPDDAAQQLERAVAAVFASWNSRRAKLYRRYHGIEDTGTAVVVQAMVFGNAGPRSGTGVAFSRDPSDGAPRLFGEYLAGGQGEDVVDGSRNVGDIAVLAAQEPRAHRQLARLSRLVEARLGDMCEIEFTLERGELWLLQARAGQRTPAAALKIALDLTEEGLIDRAEAISRVDLDAFEASLRPVLDLDSLDPAAVLTTAVGSAPGLATGTVVLDPAAAARLAEAGGSPILVRAETTPQDIEGMLACEGLLTTRGGRTSHAAVVARGLGKVCVCGAEEVAVDPATGTLEIGAETIREGEELSLDGDGGRVIRGAAPARTPPPPPALAVLRGWLPNQR